MNISLTGMNAVICGSTQGIGLAVAETLSLLGARCILLARNESRLQQAVSRLSVPAQGKHEYRVADFSDKGQVLLAIESVVSENNIHILVNNTGGPVAGPITTAAANDFENAFRQHLVNNQLLAQTVLPGMKKEGYGRIINIISTSVKIPIDNLGVSNTIRAAVAAWAKSLSNEVGQYNITVNNVLPGSTRTSRLNSLIAETAEKKQLSREAIEKEMEEKIPMKRFGLPEEIAHVAAFLASPAASYVNGVSIPVDGGRTGSI
ncbi:SDR family oxidoreductase [Agriterribacter sp.]|uniref:SDR family oxidoreductase n=1 Tax=Agriterribacter sp. TaxID=2821509 RepID=UPI002C75A0B1|nr:SDR family oxidoreductase [Agriterribacter sp.]HRO46120.1 SDR family oxidoreductase [Agriterribacter sp.]HRQ16181.1 SDR family oxidoreductase [Agriterribacter sp.]